MRRISPRTPRQSFFDEFLIALNGAVDAELFDPTVGEALSRMKLVQRRLQCLRQRLDRDLRSHPDAWLLIEQLKDASACGHCYQRQAAGCGLKQRIGQAFVPGRKNEERSAFEPGFGTRYVACEAHGRVERQLRAKGLQLRFFRPGAKNGEISRWKRGAHMSECFEKEIEALFKGQSPDCQKVRTGSAEMRRAFAC